MQFSYFRLINVSGKESIMQILIENGQNVDSQDNDGSTPLHLAAEFGMYTEMYCQCFHFNNLNRTMLCFVGLIDVPGLENIVQFLLKQGATFDSKNLAGETPLALANKRPGDHYIFYKIGHSYAILIITGKPFIRKRASRNCNTFKQLGKSGQKEKGN